MTVPPAQLPAQPVRPPRTIGSRVVIVALVLLVTILGGVNASLSTDLQTSVSRSSDLDSQLDSSKTQVASLQAQVSSLQSELSQLQAAKLRGDFWWFADCPSFSNCSYIINGAYTNMGTRTASSASIVFTVYSGPEGTGQILCTTAYVLGNVLGRTITAITEVECSGTTSNPGDTMGWRFNWT